MTKPEAQISFTSQDSVGMRPSPRPASVWGQFSGHTGSWGLMPSTNMAASPPSGTLELKLTRPEPRNAGGGLSGRSVSQQSKVRAGCWAVFAYCLCVPSPCARGPVALLVRIRELREWVGKRGRWEERRDWAGCPDRKGQFCVFPILAFKPWASRSLFDRDLLGQAQLCRWTDPDGNHTPQEAPHPWPSHLALVQQPAWPPWRPLLSPSSSASFRMGTGSKLVVPFVLFKTCCWRHVQKSRSLDSLTLVSCGNQEATS